MKKVWPNLRRDAMAAENGDQEACDGRARVQGAVPRADRKRSQ